MRRTLVMLCVCIAIGGCVESRERVPEATEESDAVGSNWMNTKAFDTNVAPADDFYFFVNGTWLRDTAIPPQLPWTSPYVRN